jgi:arylsulfatase A-like enzyme
MLLISSTALHAKTTKKPNVIIIFCDDLGYADLGVTGSKLNRTPHLDKLANEGIRFTDSYASASLCTPSRMGLLTGRYAIRSGVVDILQPWSTTGIDTSEVTIARMLQDNGYYTGIIGKWHLGHAYDHLPLQNGFQEYYGIPYSNNMDPCNYYRGNKVDVENVDQSQTTQTYTKEAIRFLKENKDRPFFLYLAHNMPHTPIFASEQFKGKSKNGLYGDVIEELDWGVGQVMKTLEDLDLDENTLVIFSSDNGPWLTMGPHGGSAFPFFQGKITNWEGGQREPTLAYWKGKIEPQVYSGMTTLLDWFPTIASITNSEVPKDRIMDGKDISDVLFNGGQREDEEFFYFHRHFVRAYRSGDYKLFLPEEVKKGNRFIADVPAHDTLLFNIRYDVAETVNLASIYPEKVKEMALEVERFKHSIKDLKPHEGMRKPKDYKGIPLGVPGK